MTNKGLFLHTLTATLFVAVLFLGVNYARHGYISWWFLVGVAAWGLSWGALGFNQGSDVKAGKR